MRKPRIRYRSPSLITVRPTIAARAILFREMTARGVSQAELGRLMKRDEETVRRIIDGRGLPHLACFRRSRSKSAATKPGARHFSPRLAWPLRGMNFTQILCVKQGAQAGAVSENAEPAIVTQKYSGSGVTGRKHLTSTDCVWPMTGRDSETPPFQRRRNKPVQKADWGCGRSGIEMSRASCQLVPGASDGSPLRFLYCTGVHLRIEFHSSHLWTALKSAITSSFGVWSEITGCRSLVRAG